MKLFLVLNAHFLLRRRAQTLLCLAGIALGVGVVAAIDAANAAALRSFRASVETVSGRANYQIVSRSGGGVDEELLATVWQQEGVEAVAPVLEQPIRIEEVPSASLTVYGVDPFLETPLRGIPLLAGTGGEDAFAAFLTQPGHVLVSRRFAERHNLALGTTLAAIAGARRIPLTILGTFEPDGLQTGSEQMAFMDVAWAQHAFARTGELDRIDLILSSEDAAARVDALLPPDAELQRPATRTRRMEQMVQSFQMNLSALSLLAVFVGAFLIFNTMTFSVIQRRPQIAALRTLGLTRTQAAILFLTEATLLGALGSILGIVVGYLVSGYTTASVAGTIATLLAPVGSPEPFLALATIFKCLVLGIVISVAAAAWPAVEAASVRPALALHGREDARRALRWAPAAAASGAVALVCAAVLAFLPGRSVLPGYVSAFLIVLGFALAAPGVLLLAAPAFSRLALHAAGSPGLLGIRSILSSLGRTGVAVGALLVAVAMSVGVALMIQSFRASLIDWITQSVRADIYISPAGRQAQQGTLFLPDEVLSALRSDPRADAVDTLRRREVAVGPRRAFLSAIQTTVQERHARYPFIDGTPSDVFAQLRAGDAVLISETLRNAARLHRGGKVTLPTPGGDHEFRIAGVYRDYSADGGQILMDRAIYNRHWPDDAQAVNSAALYLRGGEVPAAVVATLEETLGVSHALIIRSNAALRTEILRIFDSTFAITRLMQVCGLAVAFCGILSALLALTLERTRELGTLRSLGMTEGQLRAMLLVESGAMGTLASVLGCIAGVLLALLLVYVINVRSFGWTIQFQIFPATLILTAGLAIAAALLAAWYPARRLHCISVAAALREE